MWLRAFALACANMLFSGGTHFALYAQGTTASPHPSVTLADTIGADEDEIPTIRNAAADLNQVLASAEFKDAVVHMHVSQMELNGKQLTGSEVYDALVSGSPHPVKVEMVSYKGISFIMRNWVWGTEGLEDPRFPDTCFVNRHKFNGQSDQEGWLASLMLHEASHMVGFEHDTDKSPLTDSVPYELNRIYASVAPKVMNLMVKNPNKALAVDPKLIDQARAVHARVP